MKPIPALPPFDLAFQALRQHPCWGVKRGHGSFLTFEFGQPRLSIREPILDPKTDSIKVRRRLSRRFVYPYGEWHLWIYCCDWAVWHGDRLVGDSSSKRRIDRAAQFLNGQKLIDMGFYKRGARTWFDFDLGGKLETKPYNRTAEQWLLYQPDGQVLMLRADRQYSFESGEIRSGEETWQPIP